MGKKNLKKGILKRATAICSAALLVSAVFPIQALAYEADSIDIEVNSETGPEELYVEEDVSLGHVHVVAEDGYSATVETKSVYTEDEKGVMVGSVGEESDVDVLVDGNLTTADSDDYPIWACASDNGKILITVNGDVASAKGIKVQAEEAGSADVSVGGNVYTTADDAGNYKETGALVETKDGSWGVVLVEGSLYGNADVNSYGDESTSIVGVDGDIISAGTNYAYAEGGSAQLHVGGTVSTSAKDEVGVMASATTYSWGTDEESDKSEVPIYSSAQAGVEVAGDVVSDGESVVASADGEKAFAGVNVAGSVSSNNSFGAVAFAEEDGFAKIMVEGNVSGDKVGAAAGSYDDGVAIVDVHGDAVGANGALVQAGNDGISIVTVGGNATGSGWAGAIVSAASNAFAGLEVAGDLMGALGSLSGLDISLSGEEEKGMADVYVHGSILGDITPIYTNGGYEEGIYVTAWQVVPDDGGYTAVKRGEGEEDEKGIPPLEEDVEMEQNIMYIIKIEQPEAGATLTAVKEDGSDLDKSHNLGIAKENDLIYLLVDLDEGYQIVGAYNGEDEKVELLMDEDGNYYLEVPRGGAVYLSVELTQNGGEGGNTSGESSDGLSDINSALAVAVAAGGPQVVNVSGNAALSYEIMETLQKNPQITLNYTVELNGISYIVSIPGSAVKLDPNIQWYGPAWLLAHFGAIPAGFVNGIYEVRKGDTLWSISKRFNVPLATLVKNNGIKNSNRIYVGQKIKF